MRAVEFTAGVPGFLAKQTVGRLSERLTDGRLTGLRFVERPAPSLPGPDWVRLAPVLSGVCGTDLSVLAYEASFSNDPFASFPAVPGHEILARVTDVGAEVRGVRPGDRVAVDPLIGCAVRGLSPPCPRCATGRPALCAHRGEHGGVPVGGRPLSPGNFVGFHRDLPGGWGEALVAHASQLHPVDAALSDREGVLLEPLSIALHAVLGSRPKARDRVLVIGGGPIGLSVVWALRATGFEGPLTVQAKRAPETRLARALGADEVLPPGDEARAALLRTGAKAYRPRLGPEVYAGGGYDAVFDCVGHAESLAQSLRSVSEGGGVVMLGCAAELRRLDLAPVWSRELRVEGHVGYGRETWEGEAIHTFDLAQRLLRSRPAPVADLVTHVFPLARWRDALAAARHRARSGAIKVVLQPG